MNTTTFDGFLGQDPELKWTQNKTAICKLNVYVTDEWEKDGQKKESGNWVSVTLWGKKGEEFTGLKGDKVLVTGRLKEETWKTKDGSNRSKLTVTALYAAVVWTKQQIPLPMNEPGPHAPAPANDPFPPEAGDVPF